MPRKKKEAVVETVETPVVEEVVTEPVVEPEVVVDGTVDAEAVITDVDEEHEEYFDNIVDDATKYSINIRTATPLNIHIATKNNKTIATLVFLCTDNNDKLFTVSRNIGVTADKLDAVKNIPFTIDEDSTFLSNRICNSYLVKYLDNYVIDMHFTFDKDYSSSKDPYVNCKGINSSTKEVKDLIMSAEIYSVLSFVDNYVLTLETNLHDLTLACTLGSKAGKTTRFFKVDTVDEIIEMAPAVLPKKGFAKIKAMIKGEQDPNTIGLVMKVSRFINGEKESIYLLAPFDVDTAFSKDKFKGATIEKIQDKYYGESDQYVSTLLVPNTKVDINTDDGSIDKEYMTIRGKSKDHNTYIFLFDSYQKEDIIKKIKEY